MDFGNYSVTNVTQYKDYTDPAVSYHGVFRYLTENAKIIQAHSVLVVVLGTIAGAIVLSGLTVLIVILAKRRKRKDNIARAEK